jgi:hypothetical protein
MSKRKIKSRRHGKAAASIHGTSGESRAGDATTVAWTITVTMALLCDIGAVVAHFYADGYANARGALLFKELMLFSGAVIGFISLALLPIMLRVRRTPPPTGVMVFAVCVTAAPILALLLHATR